MRVAFHYQLLTNDYQLRITHCVMCGLGYFRFARRYSGNVPPFGGFFYFPPGTEMFHFPGYALLFRVLTYYSKWVSPFRNLRIKGC